LSGSPKSLIIPCETRNRELDGKLLLACAAAERGFRVFIGAKREINIQAVRLPRSIYLQKSLSKRSFRMYDILERLGHWIVTADEEGVVYYSGEHFWENRMHPETFVKARGLLAWGPDNERLWRTYPAHHGVDIAITGNPRIDLLRPELRSFFDDEVNEIHARLGPFVMINSNFGSVNHYFPRLSRNLRAAENAENDPNFAATFKGGVAQHVLALFRAFITMLPALASALPDRTFVVRPHPSESHEPWLRAALGCPNVHVIHEGNVVPWLIASDALIHNGCTTGLEAYILGTPVIAYEPVVSERFDLHLPNDVSDRASDVAELTKRVEAIGEGDISTDSQEALRRRAIVDRYVAALGGQLASERMCDALEAFVTQWQVEPLPGAWSRISGRINGQVRGFEKWFNLMRPQHNNSRSYVDHMFSELSPEDIEVRLARFRRSLGRFEKVRSRLHSRNVFEISTS
jgi:surface carbohydrate biosynthesis protein